MSFEYNTKLTDVTPMLYNPSLAVSAASAALYTNPASTTTFIGEIEIHNTNNSQISVILWYVPDNAGSIGTPSVSSQMLKCNLQGNDTIWIEPKFPYVLTDENDAVFGIASTSGVNIYIRGNKRHGS